MSGGLQGPNEVWQGRLTVSVGALVGQIHWIKADGGGRALGQAAGGGAEVGAWLTNLLTQEIWIGEVLCSLGGK